MQHGVYRLRLKKQIIKDIEIIADNWYGARDKAEAILAKIREDDSSVFDENVDICDTVYKLDDISEHSYDNWWKSV